MTLHYKPGGNPSNIKNCLFKGAVTAFNWLKVSKIWPILKYWNKKNFSKKKIKEDYYYGCDKITSRSSHSLLLAKART